MMHSSQLQKLPPKTLKRWKPKTPFLKISGLQLFPMLICIVSLYAGVVYLLGQLGFALYSGSCEKEVVPKGADKFMIDARFEANFTFGIVRTIDLAWDMVIGQGGRYLHGYILARYVANDVLVWTMERAAVPYHYYVSLSFTTVSWETIWSISKLISRRRDCRTVLSAIALLYTVIYLLVFPTLWSAATGYVTPSEHAYRMPDSAQVTLDSEGLTLCYVVIDQRMNWTNPHVELGPSFIDIDKWARDQKTSDDDAKTYQDYPEQPNGTNGKPEVRLEIPPAPLSKPQTIGVVGGGFELLFSPRMTKQNEGRLNLARSQQIIPWQYLNTPQGFQNIASCQFYQFHVYRYNALMIKARF